MLPAVGSETIIPDESETGGRSKRSFLKVIKATKSSSTLFTRSASGSIESGAKAKGSKPKASASFAALDVASGHASGDGDSLSLGGDSGSSRKLGSQTGSKLDPRKLALRPAVPVVPSTSPVVQTQTSPPAEGKDDVGGTPPLVSSTGSNESAKALPVSGSSPVAPVKSAGTSPSGPRTHRVSVLSQESQGSLTSLGDDLLQDAKFGQSSAKISKKVTKALGKMVIDLDLRPGLTPQTSVFLASLSRVCGVLPKTMKEANFEKMATAFKQEIFEALDAFYRDDCDFESGVWEKLKEITDLNKLLADAKVLDKALTGIGVKLAPGLAYAKASSLFALTNSAGLFTSTLLVAGLESFRRKSLSETKFKDFFETLVKSLAHSRLILTSYLTAIMLPLTKIIKRENVSHRVKDFLDSIQLGGEFVSLLDILMKDPLGLFY